MKSSPELSMVDCLAMSVLHLDDGSRNEIALQYAAESFADTIGCIIAGRTEEVACGVARASNVDPTRTRLSADPGSTSPSQIALINGTAAHVLEFDDHERLGVTHPSSVLVPALLALAEHQPCSGAELLNAYLAGYETIGALGLRFNPEHYASGWHATSTLGSVGAAVACGVLLGCDEERLSQAISISCSAAGGTRAQFGAPIKPVHAGLAAQAGVQSALMAQQGIKGAPEALDGPFGLTNLMSLNSRDRDTLAVGVPILDNMPIRKVYPSCAATHRTIDAIIDLMSEYGIDPCEIVSIDTEIPAVAASALRAEYPHTAADARFSMQYCAARAAARGRLSLSDFSLAELDDPTIRSIAKTVRVSPYDSRSNPFADGNYRVRTLIKSTSGRSYDDERVFARGSEASPLMLEDMRAKFAQCLEFAGVEGPSYDDLLSLNDAPSADALIKDLETALRPIEPRAIERETIQ